MGRSEPAVVAEVGDSGHPGSSAGDRRNVHLSLLTRSLSQPETVGSLTSEEWDLVVRTARQSRLLAVLAARVRAAGVEGDVPAYVFPHFASEGRVALHRRQMALWEMECLAEALTGLDGPVVLLKGAAYIAQDLPIAQGRLLSDVDLLVHRSRLDEAEEALTSAGWASNKLDAYDQHYYRAWSHELPPMRLPAHTLEIDLHHTLLPPTGRIRIDADALVRDARPLPGSRFSVLCPEDQIVHAAVHLFQDSDCSERLRDLVDVDGLIRHHAVSDSFWESLLGRVAQHGAGRPFWYSLHYAQALLGTPVPRAALESAARAAPPVPVRHVMDTLVPRVIGPVHPDLRSPAALRFARWLLYLRSHWLRMPPWLLARHLATKSLRRLRPQEAAG
jgi:hypothetical protein